MQKLVFESRELPANLSDDARLGRLRDLHDSIYCGIDLYRAADVPFSVRFEYARYGAVGVGRFEGTVQRMVRRHEAVTKDANDDFSLGVNCGQSQLSVIRPGTDVMLEPGCALLTSNIDVGDVRGGDENAWFAVNVPRRVIEASVARAEDILGQPLDSTGEPVRHLKRYLGILTGTRAETVDVALADHIGITLTDLMVLVLGAGGEAAEQSRARGLRAARQQQIVSAIRSGFLAPGFSAQSVAAALLLSPRYIHDILQQTGASFSERVLELRLQHARKLLATRACDTMKIIEIAYASGFNDVSHFNRQFRRRFGISPSDCRRSGMAS